MDRMVAPGIVTARRLKALGDHLQAT